ncbi:MAG: FAD-dependent oxidoreductase, partial [Planctomycetota bacterium]
GTRVELISRRSVFADWGPSIVEEAEGFLQDEPNLNNHAPGTPVKVSRSEGGVAIEIEAGGTTKTVEAQHLLVATGRHAAVDGLGLDLAGIEIERGRVKAGPDMRTTNDKVFVAGDATGDRLLLHVANWEGVSAGIGALGEEDVPHVERRLDMAVVFTDPPLATLGLTEAQAKEQGIAVVTAEARWPSTGRAITMDIAHGAIVLVAAADDGEILGAQILGPRADDIIHILSSVMYYQGTAKDMLAMPWYHPTLSEVLLSLAREIDGKTG